MNQKAKIEAMITWMDKTIKEFIRVFNGDDKNGNIIDTDDDSITIISDDPELVKETIVSILVQETITRDFIRKANEQNTQKIEEILLNDKIVSDMNILFNGLPFKIEPQPPINTQNLNDDFLDKLQQCQKLIFINNLQDPAIKITKKLLDLYQLSQTILEGYKKKLSITETILASISLYDNEKFAYAIARLYAFRYLNLLKYKKKPDDKKKPDKNPPFPRFSEVVSFIKNNKPIKIGDKDGQTVSYSLLAVLNAEYPKTTSILTNLSDDYLSAELYKDYNSNSIPNVAEEPFPQQLHIKINAVIAEINKNTSQLEEKFKKFKKDVLIEIKKELESTQESFFNSFQRLTLKDFMENLAALLQKLKPIKNIPIIPCGLNANANEELDYFKCKSNLPVHAVKDETICIDQFNEQNIKLKNENKITVLKYPCKALESPGEIDA